MIRAEATKSMYSTKLTFKSIFLLPLCTPIAIRHNIVLLNIPWQKLTYPGQAGNPLVKINLPTQDGEEGVDTVALSTKLMEGIAARPFYERRHGGHSARKQTKNIDIDLTPWLYISQIRKPNCGFLTPANFRGFLGVKRNYTDFIACPYAVCLYVCPILQLLADDILPHALFR